MRTDHQRFLLTRPSRGATLDTLREFGAWLISTHTPLAGRDIQTHTGAVQVVNFYSHAPRGARHFFGYCTENAGDFYSHAPRGARPNVVLTAHAAMRISTHTPLAGRDLPVPRSERSCY